MTNSPGKSTKSSEGAHEESPGVRAQEGQQASRIPLRVREKLTKLRVLETQLGHLPPDEISLTELQKRVTDPHFEFHASQLEQQTELLFGDVCDELFEVGLSPDEISAAVNRHLRYEGGPAYCNAAEVRDCLGIKE